MLLCSRYTQLFLLIHNIYLQTEAIKNYEVPTTIDPEKQDETIFTDIINNITRVNNALQDLISNYEKIQKFYDTNTFEKDYSTDIEIDEIYKNKKNGGKSRTHADNTILPKREFPATAMIVSEETTSEIADSNQVSNNATDHKMQISENIAKNSAASLKIEQENTSNEVNNKKGAIGQPHVIILKPDLGKGNKEKRLRVDYVEKARNPEKESDTTKTINVKKVIYAESFPQGKIWDEIARKKPIELRTIQISPSLLRVRNFRSQRTPKTALVILTKNNKRNKNRVEIPPDLEHVFSSEEINTKIIRANILRHAYGEACLRMVVKKCYRACKETKKVACRIASCKSSFKEKFLENAKTGCIKEFKPALLNKTRQNNTAFLKKYSKMSDFDYDGDDFDATRSGFLVNTCYPFMVPEARNETNQRMKTNTNQTITPLDIKKKILRDRYERACEKASSDKCNNACMYAYKTTCETYECAKSKKKAFRKHCKRQCRKSYKFKDWNNKKDDSESSSSASSPSESSDDESDTDFDTDDFD